MTSRTMPGILAGLAAGIVFGMMMQMMNVPTPDGGHMPMMAMVAKVVRSDSVAMGWACHLFNSAVIGGLFGALLGAWVRGYGSAVKLGAIYGMVWWVLGALILMPVLLGMPAFASLRMAPMRPIAAASLMGHVLFGMILGAGFQWLRARQSLRPTPA